MVMLFIFLLLYFIKGGHVRDVNALHSIVMKFQS